MPRKEAMITRTFKVTKATCLCLDTDTAEPFNKTVEISGVFNDQKALLKAAKNIIENDTVVVARVVDVEVEETIRGMTQQFFLENSVPVTRATAKSDTEKTGNI